MTPTKKIEVSVFGEIDPSRRANLAYEVVRAKAVLLYGDRIRIVSPKIPFLMGRMNLRVRLAPSWLEEIPDEMASDLMRSIANSIEKREHVGGTSVQPLVSQNRETLVQVFRSGDPSVFKALIEAVVVASREVPESQIRESASSFFATTVELDVENFHRSHPSNDEAEAMGAAAEIRQLIDSGFVTVETSNAESILSAEEADIPGLFVASIMDLLALDDPEVVEHALITHDGQSAPPLFRESTMAESREVARRRMEILTALFSEIPAFPRASVDELLDVRERVKPHLVRFRAAVVDLDSALDADIASESFERAVDDLFAVKVRPQLEELRASLEDEGVLPTLMRGIPSIATGSLALGATLVVGAPQLASFAAVAAGVSTATAREYLHRRSLSKGLKRNRLYLLYEAEQSLTS